MTWGQVRAQLDAAPETTVVLSKRSIAHPEEAGAMRSSGLPRGQIADWRFPPDEFGRGVHVHEYEDRWSAHLDEVHPDEDAFRHLARDTAVLPLLLFAALGFGVWRAMR
jgi:hypothetical protein